MTDDLDTLLRDRVADAEPDLDRLLRVATSQGTRIRRRRQVGVTLGAAAALAAVGVGAATMLGGAPRAGGPQFAGGPSAPATAAKKTPEFPALHPHLRFSLPSGATVEALRPAPHSISNVPFDYRLIVNGRPAQIRAFKEHDFAALKAAYPRTVIEWPAVTGTAPVDHAKGHRIAVDLKGWVLQGKPLDDKQGLAGPDGAVADLVWRPASAYAGWTTSADKGLDPMVWTSTVHDGVFVTIQGGHGTTAADVQALGQAIRWLH